MHFVCVIVSREREERPLVSNGEGADEEKE